MGVRSIRRARPEDTPAPAPAGAQRAVARLPGRLASKPDEILDEELRRTIVALNERDDGVFRVAKGNGRLVGHGLLGYYKLAVAAHVVEVTLVVHEGRQCWSVCRPVKNALIAWAREHT